MGDPKEKICEESADDLLVMLSALLRGKRSALKNFVQFKYLGGRITVTCSRCSYVSLVS